MAAVTLELGDLIAALIAGVGVVVALIALVVGAQRYVTSRLEAQRQEFDAKLSSTKSELHKRLDDFRDLYVRRDDLAASIQGLEKTMDGVRAELHRVDGKFDELMKFMVKRFAERAEAVERGSQN